jgi:hypothetical protein
MSNWNEIIKQAAKDAAQKTDDALASQIAAITNLKSQEIKDLFPNTGDAQKLAELMEIVNSADNQNQKVNRIVENSEKFGGIILKLLSKFI